MVVQSIPLITDLRTQNRNIGILYVATGQTTPGDNNGGMYMWNPSSTAADDSFYVLQVTGVATGRWLRIGAASNIYTADGSLIGNRTVTLNGYTLTFAGSTFSSTFLADGTVSLGSLVGTGTRYVVAGPTGILGATGTIPTPGTPTRFIETFTASAGQTTFNTANTLFTYFFDVYVNGVLLDNTSYTASANQIVVTDPCSLNDIVQIIGFYNITYVGTLPPQAGNAGKFLTTDGTSLSWGVNPLGTVTSVDMSVPTGFAISGNPVTTAGTLALGFAAGYSLPSNATQANWNTAYNRSLTSAAVTGTSTKTLTLNEQDGSTITATWSDYDTQGVTSVSTNVGTTGTDVNSNVINPTTTPTININVPDSSATTRGALTSTDWTTFNNKQAAITLTTTGSSGAATFIGNVLNIPNYGSALSGYVPTSRTLTINGTAYDLSANRTWSVGTVTSVNFSVPTGFAIANNPITTSGTLALTFAAGYSLPTTVKQNNWDTAYTWVAAFPTQTGNTGKFLTTDGSSLSWGTVDLTAYVPKTRTLTINGTTYDLSADRTWTIVAGVSSVSGTAPISAVNASGAVTISISQSSASTDGYLSSADWSTFNAKQPAGNYITSLTGEATASGPGAAAVTLTNSAVIGKVLTGLNVTGGSISASDSILQAFGKIQNQINGLVGGLQYQGTWNANTNTPTLTSSVGTNGYFYIVSVAGTTNLNGITDWQIGDWAVFSGTSWQKVDNTESVTSVNGFTGAVSLTTSNISEGTNLYFTNLRARQAISLTTTGTSGAATYDNTTGVLNIPQYQGGVTSFNTRTGAITLLDTDVTGALGYTPVTNARTLTINGTSYDLSANRTWSVGTVTSVGLTMPAAFTVTNSPVTGSGTLTVAGAGTSAQYIDGTGALQTFPTILDSGALVTEVYNNTGATLTKGTIVYINGGQGNLPTVTKALASGDATSAQTFGFVRSDITNMNNGYVIVAGKIYDLNTNGLGNGTQLYLSSTTAGQWTTVKQLAPNHLVYVAVVVRDHPTQGVLEVKIQNGYELDEIHDVQISSYGTKDILWRDTSVNLWKNRDIFNLMGAATASVDGYLTTTDWNTFNNKVPSTRSLSINGVSYDLSADRSWTIGPTIYSRGLQKFTATAGQTTFTITNGYTVGLVDVFRNGVKLDNATEFTATNGTTVVLTDAAALNDVIEVYKYGSEYIPNNALRTVNTFTATAAQTTFSVTYSVGLLDVFYNGSKLAAAEYTATNGTTVVLATACAVGDIVEIIAYSYLVNGYSGISGSGNSGYIPKFTSATSIGNSLIQDNGTTITLGGALSGTSATFSSALSELNVISTGASNIGNITIQGGEGANAQLTLQADDADNASDVTILRQADGGPFSIITNNGGVNALQIAATTGAATFSSSVSIGGADQGYNLDVKRSSTGDSTFDTVANFYKASTNNTGLLIRLKNTIVDLAANNVTGGGGPTAGMSFSVSSGGSISTALTLASTGAATFSSSTMNIGTSTSRGNVTIEQTTGNSGLVVNSAIAESPSLYLRDGGGAGYSTIQANNNLYINASKVGIGTTSPQNPLHIQSNTLSQLNVTALSGNTNAQINLEPIGTGIALIGPANNVDFALRTNATERMRITSGGNVGIGISPSELLHVYKSSTFATILLENGSSNVYSLYQAKTANSGLWQWGCWNNNTYRIGLSGVADYVTINSSGNVGIGTTSPGTTLTVEGANSAFPLAYNTGYGNVHIQTNETTATQNYGGSLTFGGLGRTSGPTEKFIWAAIAGRKEVATSGDPRGYLQFGTCSDDTNQIKERMRITSMGQISQTTSIADWSHVISNASSTSPNGIIIQYTNANKNGTSNQFLYCTDNFGATLRFEVRSNGGIANYSANNVSLSDIRTKKDIVSLESYWDKFKALEIVKFKYNDQTHDDYNIGVIAQQVESVAPEFVDVDGWGETPEDGVPLKSIYTADLYHATIKVLQEAMEKIESLEKELDALKNK